MIDRINILKGIHPGKIIERDLNKNHMTQRVLAEIVRVPYQTINAIISGRRNITLETALNIERILGYDEGFLLILQDFHNISTYKEKKSKENYNHAPNIRKSLFWDSDFNKIDWERYKKAVITRIWERGNQSEKEEIIRFYNIKATDIGNYILASNYPDTSKDVNKS
jgi:addiction module HigA family antidote